MPLQRIPSPIQSQQLEQDQIDKQQPILNSMPMLSRERSSGIVPQPLPRNSKTSSITTNSPSTRSSTSSTKTHQNHLGFTSSSQPKESTQSSTAMTNVTIQSISSRRSSPLWSLKRTSVIRNQLALLSRDALPISILHIGCTSISTPSALIILRRKFLMSGNF